MKRAVARRRRGYEHEVEIREHHLIVDEPDESGGTDQGPRRASCSPPRWPLAAAITIEMYADRKEWGLGTVEVAVDYTEATTDDPHLRRENHPGSRAQRGNSRQDPHHRR